MNSLFRQLNLLRRYYLTSRPARGPERQTDFEMHLIPIDVPAYTKSLRELCLDHKTLATIPYEGGYYEILQLDTGNTQAAKKLLVFAGVHGNESAAALAVPDLLGAVSANPEDYKSIHIRIITPVNPVGLAYGSRYNEAGYDINRDFKEFSTVGARVQRDAVETFQPDAVISFHEGPQDGFFMFSEGKLPSKLREEILERLREARIPLADKSFFQTKLASGILEKPAIITGLQKLIGIHTLGPFASKHRIPVITTESSWTGTDIGVRKRPHVLLITAVASRL